MKTQWKIQIVCIAILMFNLVSAQKKISPAATTHGQINEASIVINYSSPFVKGRKIWGELVPFDKVWRAGANKATTFETDKELVVEGSKLPAGKYSFFVIPSKKKCVIIFNKDAKQWGAFKYNEAEDQLRVTVKQKIRDSITESLVYKINKNDVVLSWEKWDIPIRIK